MISPPEPLPGEPAEPRFSVIIPTYNRASRCLRAIESVRQSTRGDLIDEILVIDDASTDDTVARLEALAPREPRLRILQHGRNRGGSAARNTGIFAATAPWVAFLDSDDTWHPQKIEAQAAVIAHRSDPEQVPPGAIYCGFVSVDANCTETQRFHPSYRGDLGEALLGNNVVRNTSLFVVRRDILTAIQGFDEALPSCQDWDLWIRLAQRTAFDFDPRPLVQLDVAGNDRITRQQRKRMTGVRMIARKHLQGRTDLPRRTLSQIHATVGDILMLAGHPRLARPFLWSALRGSPTSPAAVLKWLLAGARCGSNTYERLSRLNHRKR